MVPRLRLRRPSCPFLVGPGQRADGEHVPRAAGWTVTPNRLAQASFDPPLVMAGVKADSGSAAIIGETGTVAVNVLAGDQLDIGEAFFRSTSTPCPSCCAPPA